MILGERDEQQVAEEVRGLGGPAEAAVRAAFASYGTCSVTDPVDDLVRLGLVRGEAA